jgi:hypothetical protein
MSRASSVLIAFAIAAANTVAAQAQQPPRMYGDVSADGRVSAIDAQAVLTAVVGLSLPTSYRKTDGDADCDGSLAAKDAQIILTFSVLLPAPGNCVGNLVALPVANITVAPYLGAVGIGESLDLSVTAFDSAGAVTEGGTMTWASLDPAIATVTPEGRVTGLQVGVVTITATTQGKVGGANITVLPTSPGTVNLTVKGLPSGAPAPKIVLVHQNDRRRPPLVPGPNTGIIPGFHISVADPVLVGNKLYQAFNNSVDVFPGVTTDVTVEYTDGSPSNLVIIKVEGIPAGSAAPIDIVISGSLPFRRNVATVDTVITTNPVTIFPEPLVYEGVTYYPENPMMPASGLTIVRYLRAGRIILTHSGYTGGFGPMNLGYIGAAIVPEQPVPQRINDSTYYYDAMPGYWSLNATAFTGGRVPNPRTQLVKVTSGDTVRAAVKWSLGGTGNLLVRVTGLPTGVAPSITATGPQGATPGTTYTFTTNSGGVSGIPTGQFEMAGAEIVSGADTYAPFFSETSIAIGAGQDKVVDVIYVPKGTVAVIIEPLGLAPTVQPKLHLSMLGPTTVNKLVEGPGPHLVPLSSGQLSYQALGVGNGGQFFRAIAIPNGLAFQNRTIVLSPAYESVPTGFIDVQLLGLPAGAPQPRVELLPNLLDPARLYAGIPFTGVPAGRAQLRADTIRVNGFLYQPIAWNLPVMVPAAGTVTATFQYVRSADVTVRVNGLPAGAEASIGASGALSFVTGGRTVGGVVTFTDLAPGPQEVSAAEEQLSDRYGPTLPKQQVVLVAGQPNEVTFTYRRISAHLTVTIAGLPTGVTTTALVTGPNNFSLSVNSGTTLRNLVPGNYRVRVNSLNSGGQSWVPETGDTTRTLGVGATESVAMTYRPTVNLVADGAYFVQSIQSYTGNIPLIAGRDALLRVFVLANVSNSTAPRVRVVLSRGGTTVQTSDIPAPTAFGVPTTLNQASLTASWNLVIPGALVQPGLSATLQVDPDNLIPETNELDNGVTTLIPVPVTVMTAAPLNVRFVPVRQNVNGRVGNVTAANKDQLSGMANAMFPVMSIPSDVHAVFATDAPPLDATDGNGAWNRILNEIDVLRVGEGTGQYYYGVVNLSYSSGYVGLGFMGGKTAIGRDGGDAVTFAHELGHNLNRMHAPCGSPSGVDPDYPFANGSIGTNGYDSRSGVTRGPTLPDIMAYCSDPWVSEYTWRGILNYRNALGALVAEARPESSLVVWGRFENGRAILEPAFTTVTRPSMPTGSGPATLELSDGTGRSLMRLSFVPTPVADKAGDTQFAFAIPHRLLAGGVLSRIRLQGAGMAAALSEATGQRPPSTPLARRVAGARGAAISVTWDATASPVAIFRAVGTNQIVGIGRSGSIEVDDDAGGVDVILSTGVRSTTYRVVPR